MGREGFVERLTRDLELRKKNKKYDERRKSKQSDIYKCDVQRKNSTKNLRVKKARGI